MTRLTSLSVAARALVLLTLVATACRRAPRLSESALSAGAATVFDETRDAFSQPLPRLSAAHRRSFFVGNSFFNQNWLSAPASVSNRDGLGPLFNARSCSSCHFKDGRSGPPDAGQPLSTMLLRISRGDERGPGGAPLGDPVYGDQIQGSALPGLLAEADVMVDYDELRGEFADGEAYVLRRPRYRLEHLGYGPVSPALLMSARVAPAMIGLGLLETVAEAELRALADPDDANHDGISGRSNRVWDAGARAWAIGRFGWKAEQPTVVQQVAAAFLGDMGLSSTLFPSKNHTEGESPCDASPDGGSPEVEDDVLAAIGLYARSLAVPARRNALDPAVTQGAELFVEIGCASCHAPTLWSEPGKDLAELGRQEIHPFTDLLLHDLGDGLSDQRPSFAAVGAEWRTAPLWGLGLLHEVNGHTFLLHDGRARDVAEAILWHDGEAKSAQRAFVQLKRAERAALLAFLNSL
jgi:CxxC motif-containing protein (DUF1111 family)